ncbi:C-C motif chemokine 23-like isoform X2 [Silurus meridionalis]|nr:C-C motif chemokine 23-like isoform X2 [Silurus meridionalis]
MDDFCLNTDTPVYMDSSTVQSQEILTTFSILATTNPDQQDQTEHLHTLQTHRGSGVNEAAGLCCFEFHKTSIAAAYIVSVEETRSDCTLPGVILTTKKGSRMCVDPEVDWVKQIISKSEIKEKIVFSLTDVNGAALCCFQFHQRPIPAVNIVSVAKTRFDCTLPGVILTTKKGYRICVDPEVDWVKKIMKITNMSTG